MSVNRVSEQIAVANLVLSGSRIVQKMALDRDGTTAFMGAVGDQLVELIRAGKKGQAADLSARLHTHLEAETIAIDLGPNPIPNGMSNTDRFFASIEFHLEGKVAAADIAALNFPKQAADQMFF